MKKVITYGTYDLLHEGHIRLLKRAKALGDYLIVGVTADGFDRTRGKINVQQSLMERVEAGKATGLADKIIVEEYEGQKIDDIRKYEIDIFTVGSDWTGKFDYLNEFCKVVYLDRTEGISSTKIRSERKELRIGLIGETSIVTKFRRECGYVNGVSVSGVLCEAPENIDTDCEPVTIFDSLESLLEASDAVYVASMPEKHYSQTKAALERGKHVLCESPITLKLIELDELYAIAQNNGLILMDAVKTAYSTAFNRLILLVKAGIIGEVMSVDTTCTSLADIQCNGGLPKPYMWNSLCWWGPNAMLPIFDIFGSDIKYCRLSSRILEGYDNFDLFTKGFFVFGNGTASFKVGLGVKSEGEMVISGTKGYIYVPAPWWKTDYFEVRYEDQSRNKRYFYQLEGEGIRYEILSFLRQIEGESGMNLISESTTRGIVGMIEKFYAGDYDRI